MSPLIYRQVVRRADHVALGAPGVWRALNELSHTHDLMHLAGTTLVAYRPPGDG